MATLVDLRSEREGLRAARAKQDFEAALAQMCTQADRPRACRIKCLTVPAEWVRWFRSDAPKDAVCKKLHTDFGKSGVKKISFFDLFS